MYRMQPPAGWKLKPGRHRGASGGRSLGVACTSHPELACTAMRAAILAFAALRSSRSCCFFSSSSAFFGLGTPSRPWVLVLVVDRIPGPLGGATRKHLLERGLGH